MRPDRPHCADGQDALRTVGYAWADERPGTVALYACAAATRGGFVSTDASCGGTAAGETLLGWAYAPPANGAGSLTVPEKGQYGFGLPRTTWETSWMMMDFVWQAGGEMIRQEPDGRWRVAFNGPEGAAAPVARHQLELVAAVREPVVHDREDPRGASLVPVDVPDVLATG